MVQSFRKNIYLSLVLVGALFFLWFINYSWNKAFRDSDHLYAQVVELDNFFSRLVVREQEAVGNAAAISSLLDQEQQFSHKCSACHAPKTDLPDQRVVLLVQRHDILVKSAELRQGSRQRLSSLIESVRYIHEHHIAALKNFLEHNRGREAVEGAGANWKKTPGRSAPEPDIIKQAVAIQHALSEILSDFYQLSASSDPGQVFHAFKGHTDSFYQAVKVFEDYSLDAQDGILVEELLSSGRVLESHFAELVAIETENRLLAARLQENRNGFATILAAMGSRTLALRDTLRERLFTVNLASLLLAAFLALIFFTRARSIMKSIDTLVEETEKISHDFSYQIPEHRLTLTEFIVLRNALNALAEKLNRQVLTLQDEIQTRRRMESLLMQGKKEWERTFDAVPDMIFILDRESTIIRANRAMANLLDIPIQAIIGRKCYEVVHDRTSFPRYCVYRYSGDALSSAEQPILLHNEFYEERLKRHFSATVSALSGPEGALIGYVHVVRDITEQKQTELEREEYALYLDSILFSSASTAIVATGTDLRIKYFNPEAERIFARSANETLGVHLAQIHEAVLAANKGAMAEERASSPFNQTMDEIRGGKVHSIELELGAIVVDARISPIMSPSGSFAGFLLMANDITGKVKAEKQRRLLEKRLQKAEKMEAIGLMAGGVAHDLNNILSGIINYPELMLLQMEKDSRWKNALETVRDSGVRAAAIVADLLTIARGVACEKELCSINRLVDQYIGSAEFKTLAARHPRVEVSTRLDEGLWSCTCSPLHIQKLLMNLVTNGVEAVSGNGTVTVSTVNEEIRQENDRKGEVPAGKYIKMTVADTGPGIPEQYIQRIFEPFFSKKKMGHSGTGLGLAVAWNTVQDHKGFISVASGSGGTCFTVRLPASETMLELKPDEELQEEFKGSGLVLIVDDEPLQREVAGQMFEYLGFKVVTASNGREAVEYIRDHEVDLILLDMVMEPDMNGRQTLEEILQFRPDQKTLIASGFADGNEVKMACSLGNTRLIVKPYKLNRLTDEVQRILKG